MQKSNRGFTLIEIAIVLVIVGLLLGGVLAGQELIRSARVRNLISQQDGAKAAFFGFEDRYRALPGDYSQADVNIACPATCLVGNGNGRIEPGTGGAIREDILAWSHLSAAGFLNGSYTMTSGPIVSATPQNTPQNPYGAYVQVAFDHAWGDSFNAMDRHTIKTGNQIPVAIIAEVDRKIDDGLPYTGAFQFSTFAGAGGGPDVGGTNDDSCTNIDGAGVPGANGTWSETVGQPNCGGASLL
ncbi:MAG: prepilin-type N-terminal cleavage/methylation domain-containing protein [Betaproteobacteria bacterium]